MQGYIGMTINSICFNAHEVSIMQLLVYDILYKLDIGNHITEYHYLGNGLYKIVGYGIPDYRYG